MYMYKHFLFHEKYNRFWVKKGVKKGAKKGVTKGVEQGYSKVVKC